MIGLDEQGAKLRKPMSICNVQQNLQQMIECPERNYTPEIIKSILTLRITEC